MTAIWRVNEVNISDMSLASINTFFSKQNIIILHLFRFHFNNRSNWFQSSPFKKTAWLWTVSRYVSTFKAIGVFSQTTHSWKICWKFINHKTDYSRYKYELPVPFMGRIWRPGDRLWTALIQCCPRSGVKGTNFKGSARDWRDDRKGFVNRRPTTQERFT